MRAKTRRHRLPQYRRPKHVFVLVTGELRGAAAFANPITHRLAPWSAVAACMTGLNSDHRL